MTDMTQGAIGADGRARAEAALARYPDLSEEELAALKHWFHREASALDVAQVASNEAIVEAYRAFRTAHIDRFTPRDLVNALLFASAVALCLLAIVWPAL